MSPDAANILADLARHATTFEMHRDGLGESLCKATTDGVAATIAAQEAPDGTPWPDLSPAYATAKAKKYPGKTMGHLHELMTDPAQLAGDVIVLTDQAMVTYGIDEEARAEAAAFQQGDPAQNRPPRPFWGLTADSKRAVDALLAARLKRVIG